MLPTRRRAVLRAIVGAALVAPALAACDLLDFTPDPPPPPDPLTAFYDDTLALIAIYEAQMGADARLPAIRDNHRAHAQALAAVMRPAPPSPSAAPPSPLPSAPPEQLRETEQKAWQKALDACVAAPAERSTLLGEIAAARAAHVEVLS